MINSKAREACLPPFSRRNADDFGDGVRSGTSTGAEDERDLTKVGFSKELYAAFARGFAGEAGRSMTRTEKSMLYFGAILMTYECGMRFLTDYLEGDVYFRVDEPLQNLHRARNQFKLVEDMEKKLKLFNRIVADTARDLSIGGGK